ncbi:MAG: anaerobic glycerol-3-phosphate dehydrogenase subunit B [Deltaproteobacteria bacterium]|nr:anaerobic glycerol-3-phosphate dehydrogenase subunit B [Deltaproteobacteria bacterium]
MDFDTIVIGGGLSGLVAAAASAQKGQRVGVVSSGMGDMLTFTGCIDLLAYYPGESTRPGPAPDILLDQLAADNSEHPYALAGRQWIEDAIRFFKGLLPEWEYQGNLDRLIPLPTVMGTVKLTGIIPRSMSAGDLEEEGEMLVVGFQGLREFSAPSLAGNLAAAGSEHMQAEGVRGETITVDDISKCGGATNTALARRLEREDLLDSIVQQVRPLVGTASRIGFPAILGLTEDGPTREHLEGRLGVRIFEVPGLPPSIPGQRLFNHLHNALSRFNVRLMLGSRVMGVSLEDRQCRSIHVFRHGRTTEMCAHRFILATGGIRGGGLVAERSGLLEPLYGLPVCQPSKRGTWFRTCMFDPEGHPLDRSGVKANTNLQPVDAAGRVLIDNVRVCGRILAYQDPLREKSGGGVAVATGFKAGSLCADE